MNARRKPSEVIHLEAGEVEQSPPSAVEQLLESLERGTYRGSEILDIKPRRWLSPGWLPADSVVAVYAPPGVGKSFYALSLALEMSRGGWWATSKLPASPVLYVAAERATELRDRAEAWSLHNGEQLPGTLELVEPEDGPPQLNNPLHVEALCRKVQASGARLVVLDTYARMTLGLEENSAKETGPILEALNRIRKATDGGAVLVVHHTGKDASRGLRGSSAFLGAVDLTISLEGSEGTLRAKVEKSNAGPSPMPEWFTLETVPLPTLEGEARTSAVLVSTGAPARNAGLEEAVLALLGEASPLPMSRKELMEALEESGRKVTRASLDRQALNPLRDRGAIELVGKGPAARYQLTRSVSDQLTP